MKLTDDIRYRALLARDTRFDGLFFVGVSSTAIYCRSVCPARKPKREHCTFYPSAAAAEAKGFRPCMRCRPELAPWQTPLSEFDSCAPAIIARIQSGALNNGSTVEDLARQFDLSARQLQRIVREHAGVSPIELAQSSRLLLAKQLLTETSLPVTRVAYASGYASIRRFNEAFSDHYRMQPRRFRDSQASSKHNGSMKLRLSYRPPLDFEAVLRFLGPRAIRGVEHVTDREYLRTVAIGDCRGWLRVRSHRGALEAEITPELSPAVQPILARLRTLFDLSARPDQIDAHLKLDDRLAPLVRANPGMRVPGAFDPFELAWRAVLGQQISVKGATTLAGRLASTLGEPIQTPFQELSRLSPSSNRIARANPSKLAAIGLPTARAQTLREIARVHAADSAVLEPGAPLEQSCARLLAIPGVGPWTVAYIAMRALRDPDAFPESDLGLKHALGVASPVAIRKLAEPWRPWRAYAATHFWAGLAKKATA